MSNNVAAGTPALPADLFAGTESRHVGETVRGALKLMVRNPLGTFGLLIIVAFLFIAVFAPLLAPYDFKNYLAGQPSEGMSVHHWFGTDRLGRDTLSRDIYGARISLSVAFISVLGGSALGTMFGIISGYSGGPIDSLTQRVVDTAIAFPQLLLLLIIVQTLGPSFRTVVIAIMLGIIPGVTRVIRGAALSEKNNQYIEAARSIGASTPRILFRHVLPNVMALAIVIMSTLLGAAILAEAGLSFLGLGIPEPAASWGRDVSTARDNFPLKVPAAFFPGAAITLTVLGFNLLGDSIRDIADPRLRGSR
jgi:peptide/nickel transport system permease protein